MNAWLYQMSSREEWTPEDYRVEVWEGRSMIWPAGKIAKRGLGQINAGDVVFLFFVKSRNEGPGIYGLGVILRYMERREEVEFQVVTPSDYLKIDPIWDDGVRKLVDKIRGKMTQGTLWGIKQDEFIAFQKRVRERSVYAK